MSPVAPLPAAGAPAPRITSIDAVRGLVMFAMIYVNDLAEAPATVVPWWMRHFKPDGNGLTFVDLVFPAFLFIVGMSIPFALGARLQRGEAWPRTLLHVVNRTASLLFLGVLMVNESPDTARLGWSATLWSALMFASAILAFCSLNPMGPGKPGSTNAANLARVSRVLRWVGLTSLIALAFAFRGTDGHRIVTLVPFSLHTDWYGILGLIGWAYLVGAIVFLLFHGRRTALLGCAVLLLCLYPADRTGAFKDFWLAHYVGVGETLGSQAAITVAGVLLASILLAPDTTTVGARTRFTLLFIAGCAAAAWLLHGLYGINKNSATPSWCLWACAATAALWLLAYFLADVRPGHDFNVTRPFALAGQNVLLAYLLHNLLYPTLGLLGWDAEYARFAEAGLAQAVGRSLACATVVLTCSFALNRAGLRLKL